MTEEQWGPWIEHDGRGCPCIGEYVQGVGDCGGVIEAEVKFDGPAWHWSNAGIFEVVIRYRIRKPRGIVVLESLLADLPERVDA